MTVKRQMIAVFTLIMTIFCLSILIVYSQLRNFAEQSQQIMTEYNSVTGFANAFSAEESTLELYIRPSSREGATDAYLERIAETNDWLNVINPEQTKDSSEDYRVKRSLKNAMAYYRETQEKMLTSEEETRKVAYYASMTRQEEYIKSYSRELLRLQMQEGDDRWEQIQRDNTTNMNRMIVLLFASAAMLFACVAVVDKTILQPLENISRAADEIYAGNYHADPLPEDRSNELGKAARSFNLMQRQIRDTIDTMEKQAEMEKNLLEKEVEAEHMKRRLEEGRFAALQSQINPHFLFNTLNTISALAHEEGGFLTEDLILRLARFFRYSLESDEKIVKLGQEIKLLRDYEELQETRHGDRITFEIEQEQGMEDLEVPKFILQPLVENAIIHGFHESGGTIRVKCRMYRGKPTIFITDNGDGFIMGEQKEKTGRKSVGLKNVQTRVEYAGGSMKTWSMPGFGTCIKITLGVDQHA